MIAAGRVVLLLLLLLGGCARGRPAPAANDEARLDRPVPLTVENRYRFDVNVYVTRGGTQQLRLGVVVASTSKVLSVPASYAAGGFHLVADPIGASSSSTYRSERVTVTRPGDRVVWTLESSLARSSVGVY